MPLTRARALASANKQVVIHGRVIPFDVIAAIIEFLDFDTLKMASLTCHWLRYECSRWLFRTCAFETTDASAIENSRVLRVGLDFIKAPERAIRLQNLSIHLESLGKGMKGPFQRLMTKLFACLEALNVLEDLSLYLSLTRDQEIVFGKLLATHKSFSPRLRDLAGDVDIRAWGPFLDCHPLLTSLTLSEVPLISDTPTSRFESFHVTSLPCLKRLHVAGPISASLLPIAPVLYVGMLIYANESPVSEIATFLSNTLTPIPKMSFTPVIAERNDLTTLLDALTEKADHLLVLKVCLPRDGEDQLERRHLFCDVINSYIPRFSNMTHLVWDQIPKCMVLRCFAAVSGLESLKQVVVRVNACAEEDGDMHLFHTFEKLWGSWEYLFSRSTLDYDEIRLYDD